MRAALIYPHQLFPKHPANDGVDLWVLVEEPLLFTQYRFHAQKLMLHRATLRHDFDRLRQQGKPVHYVEAGELRTTADIAPLLAKLGVTHVQLVDPCDDWMEQRLKHALAAVPIECEVLDDPHFLTPWSAFDDFAADRSHWLFSDFYVQQRR